MSNLHVFRLAQYWDWRIKPLLGSGASSRPLYPGELAEAIGWLVEGVFCGFFKAEDADVAWVRIQQAIDGRIDDQFVPPRLFQNIRRLQRTPEPFKASQQMFHGIQRSFELPLFAHALLLADRFASDDIAYRCSVSLFDSNSAFEETVAQSNTVDTASIAAMLCGSNETASPLDTLLTGFIRLLEHMKAGELFVDYSRSVAKKRYGIDFEAYTQRVISLSGWRVPLMNPTGRQRFLRLGALFQAALRADPDASKLVMDGYYDGLDSYLSSLKDSWEAAQLSGFLTSA